MAWYHSRRVDIQKFDGIRRYVFAYVAGLLWLIALCLAFITEGRIIYLARYISTVSTASGVTNIPQSVWIFGLIVAGVVIPYCISLAVSPLTLAFSNVVLNARFRSLRHAKLGDAETIFETADRIVQATTDATFSHTDGAMLLYVDAVVPRLAVDINRAYDDLFFRIDALIPSACLIGIVIYRVTAVHWVGVLLASVAAIAVLVGGALQLYDLLMQCRRRVCLTIVLAKKNMVITTAP